MIVSHHCFGCPWSLLTSTTMYQNPKTTPEQTMRKSTIEKINLRRCSSVPCISSSNQDEILEHSKDILPVANCLNVNHRSKSVDIVLSNYPELMTKKKIDVSKRAPNYFENLLVRAKEYLDNLPKEVLESMLLTIKEEFESREKFRPKNKQKSAPKIKSILKARGTSENSQKAKSVKFAEDKDLVRVKFIESDLNQTIPLEVVSFDEQPPPAKPVEEPPNASEDFHYIPFFQNPGYTPEFRAKLVRQRVCLEHCRAFGSSVTGTIAVMDDSQASFEKRVLVRLSCDDWKTFRDTEASYREGSYDGQTSRFVFSIYLGRNSPHSVEFAICYCCTPTSVRNEDGFWDNNQGKNYRLSKPYRNHLHLKKSSKSQRHSSSSMYGGSLVGSSTYGGGGAGRNK